MRDPANIAPDVVEVSGTDLLDRLRRGDVSSVDLVDAYLARIDAIDREGPTLRSVIEVNQRAREIAADRDEARGRGHATGLLFGLPIVIKDNIATTDGMETTAGSLALVGSRPPYAAHVVDLLERAGAIIVGKTNLSEWANFRSTTSTSGWSGRGGLTLNPYALGVTPSGSSSGSGVAAAASLAAMALGTETNGSVLSPAAANDLVGLKPTVGRISRFGVIPISETQDTVGPMTRTVRDAALLFAAIAGPDPRDPTTLGAPPLTGDLMAQLDADALSGARLGVPRRKYWGYSRVTDAVGERALATLRDAGATVIDETDVFGGDVDHDHLGELAGFVLRYEFHAGVDAWFESVRGSCAIRDLAGLIAFNEAHADEELRFFGQEVLEQAVETGSLDDPAYVDARETTRNAFGRDGIERVLDQHRLDALVMPTMAPPSSVDLVNGGRGGGGSAGLAAVPGYPSITVPAGHVFGLPVGLTFVGRKWSEPLLLRLAFAFEQRTMVRTSPVYAAAGTLPSIDRPERA